MNSEPLGEPVEVAPERTRGQVRRLVLSLLGVGLLLGLIFGVGSWIVGTWAQTEQGLCRVTWAPCSELSLESVQSLAGVDLPPDSEVESGYAQELGTLHEFRAVVVLPSDGVVTLSSAYDELDSLSDLPSAARELDDPTFWTRPVRGEGHDLAIQGTRSDGRTVIVFDERQVPHAP